MCQLYYYPNLGFRFAACDQAPKAGRQSELRLPRDRADGFRQRFLPVEHLPADARNALIGPGRFGEQSLGVRIARLGDPAPRTLGPLEYSEGTRPRYAISSR